MVTDRLRRRVISYYVRGVGIRGVAAAVGLSYGTVRSILVSANVPMHRRGYRKQYRWPPVGVSKRREQLSRRLLNARLATGLTGSHVARLVKFSQSKLSKIETGEVVRPKIEDIEALADVYGLRGAERDRLLKLARAVHQETAAPRQVPNPRGSQRQGNRPRASAHYRPGAPVRDRDTTREADQPLGGNAAGGHGRVRTGL